jgi:hypothetical protein
MLWNYFLFPVCPVNRDTGPEAHKLALRRDGPFPTKLGRPRHMPRRMALYLANQHADCGRDPVKRFRRPRGTKRIVPLDEAKFPAREDRQKPTPDTAETTGPEKTPLIWTQRKWEDGNETAFTHDCISSTRLRSDFGSDEVDASNAAFRCRWGRLEVQQVGVDSNHLRAQPRCPIYNR